MKTCGGKNCNKLVKNSYTHCFECNNKANKDDSSSDVDTSPYVKESIPKCVRNALFVDYFGNSREGKCQMCFRETISLGNFQAGHIISEANGGRVRLDNLRPVCQLCNTSSGKMNMDDFIKKYNMTYFVKESDIKPLNKNM